MSNEIFKLLNTLTIEGDENVPVSEFEPMHAPSQASQRFPINLHEIATNDYSVVPTRILFLLKSYEAICDNNFLQSLYYETLSMGLWMRNRFSIDDYIRMFIINENVSDIVTTTDNELINFVTQENEKRKLIPTNNEPLFHPYEVGIKKLLNNYKELPVEWTVIQLCKQFNCKQWYSTHTEHIGENRPLNITILKHGSIEINEPLSIVIPINSKWNFFDYAFDTSNDINLILGGKSELFQSYNDLKTTILPEFLIKFKQYIGQWITLLTGATKCSEQQKIEQQLLNDIQQFSIKHKFVKRQEYLLFFLLRQIHLINPTADNKNNFLQNAIAEIASKKSTEKLLLKFINEMKKKYPHCACCLTTQNYPCILIVDELLDHIPWEINLPYQEYSRCSSFTAFFSFFTKYKSKISNGYVKKSFNCGNLLINPDGTLENSAKRLQHFYDNCLPHWKYRIREIPTIDEMHDLMTSSDIFIYAGHGSGVQYMYTKKMIENHIESVLFLYGCESIAIKTEGRTETLTAKKLLELSHCPAVVGSLNIITDLWSDVVTVTLLKRWLNINMSNWEPDSLLWQISKTKFTKIYENNNLKCEPSLLANLALLKCDETIPLYMRWPIICRGLPVYNE